MSEYFELIIFTAGTEEYADWALGFFENVDCISHRLYRQHALPFNGFYVKDLSRIGRDLSKTIIVDNIAENFQMQPNNGIFIKTWISDPYDHCLFILAPLLRSIVVKKCANVQDVLKYCIQQNEAILQSIAYGSKDEGAAHYADTYLDALVLRALNDNKDKTSKVPQPIDEMSNEESVSNADQQNSPGEPSDYLNY